MKLPMIALIVLAAVPIGCIRARERPTVPEAGRARAAELEKENERLRGELQAAQQTSGALDESLHHVEEALASLPGLDTRIQRVRRDIETGTTKPDDSLDKRIKQLRELLDQRKHAVSLAQQAVAVAEQQAAKVVAEQQERYLGEIETLKKAVAEAVAANTRLTEERDQYESKYREAVAEAKREHEKAAAAQTAADEEHREREQAERDANRVLVVVAPIGNLRKKGIVRGHWYQHKTVDCTCADCFTEYDRRTLTGIPIPAARDRVNVYSTHPKGSYGVTPIGADASQLDIRDKDKFWSGVRCAVVGF